MGFIVIDKDFAPAVPGADIGPQERYILTDVPEVYLDFRSNNHRPLRRTAVAAAFMTKREFK